MTPATAGKMFLTPEEVVQRYEGRINVRTLANWRSAGTSPPFVKAGGRVLYPLDKLVEWEQQRTVTGTHQYTK